MEIIKQSELVKKIEAKREEMPLLKILKSLTEDELQLIHFAGNHYKQALKDKDFNSLYLSQIFFSEIEINSDKNIQCLDALIEIAEDKSIFYHFRAVIYYNREEYLKAISDFTKIIEIKAQASAYFNRGLSYENLKETDKAISDMSIAIKLKPNYAKAYNSRGNLYDDLKQYKKAIADFTKAIKFKPNYSEAYNNRGVCFQNIKEYTKAISDYNEAIKKNRNNAYPYRNLGFYYYRIEIDFLKAYEYFNKAIEIDKLTFSFLKYYRDDSLNKLKENDEIRETSFTKNDIPKILVCIKHIEARVKLIKVFAKANNSLPVVHYTKLNTLQSIVTNDEGSKSRLRYYNVVYMNDPEEGKNFFDCFNDKKISHFFENGKRLSETSVYLGCFMPVCNDNTEPSHHDELVMWRTYGKDENKNEATGCNMIIRGDFFDVEDEITSPSTAEKKSSTGKVPQPLYRVLYHKKGKFENDVTGGLGKTLATLEQEILKLISFKKKYSRDKEVNYIDKRIFECLSRVCYLFKSSDYLFEHEVRVVHHMPLGNDEIYASPNNNISGEPPLKLYILSNNQVLSHLDKIYLGPKVPNANHWSVYLDYEIRKRLKEDKIDNNVEVIKSACSFQ